MSQYGDFLKIIVNLDILAFPGSKNLYLSSVLEVSKALFLQILPVPHSIF